MLTLLRALGWFLACVWGGGRTPAGQTAAGAPGRGGCSGPHRGVAAAPVWAHVSIFLTALNRTALNCARVRVRVLVPWRARAASLGHVNVAKALLDAGANVNLVDRGENTPLCEARLPGGIPQRATSTNATRWRPERGVERSQALGHARRSGRDGIAADRGVQRRREAPQQGQEDAHRRRVARGARRAPARGNALNNVRVTLAAA